MPRTTLDLDASILGELRARAAREGKSMGRVASELIAQGAAGEADNGAEPERPPFKWHTAKMGKPLVDLEDKDAVWAILDADLMRDLDPNR